MKILQIDSARFGSLSIDTPVVLEEGLNLWIAENQSGKTTLLTFLEWMLFGPASKRGAKDPQAIKRWTPWIGGTPSGRLVIKPELEGWPEKILVNTVGPGRIDTERVAQLDQIWAEQKGITYTDQRHQSENTIPLGTYGEPADFARIVVFLCSEANAYLTGQNLLIDGGMVGAY